MSSIDHQALTQLNQDDIISLQNFDVERFDEILASDFRCSNPGGSIFKIQDTGIRL